MDRPCLHKEEKEEGKRGEGYVWELWKGGQREGIVSCWEERTDMELEIMGLGS